MTRTVVGSQANSMRRMMPGLYEGNRVRAERTREGGWSTDVKVRDCGEILGVATGFFEGHDDGTWRNLGSYRTLAIAQRACEALFAGTHVLRPAHGISVGPVPARLVPFAEAPEEIAEVCAAAPPAP